MCSSDTSFNFLKVWTCPNERQCGAQGYKLALSADGGVTSIALNTVNEQFLMGDICKYQIEFPEYVSISGDLMVLKVKKLTEAQAWIYVGQSFTQIESEQKLSAGSQIIVKYPNKAFVVFYSSNVFPGDFSF